MEKVKLLFRKKSVKIVLCTVVIIAGLVLLAMFAWFNAAKTTATWDGYTQTEPAGSGTEDDPFLIANGSNLAWVAEMTNIQADYIRGKYFKQTANIDLCNKVWVPIGRDVNYSFQGTYDGENYNISNISVNTASCAGLFGYISEATIKNVNITSGNIKSSENTGGIAGAAQEKSKIIFCNTAVAVESTGSNVGGIVGYSDDSISIIACRNSGSVTLKTSSSAGNAEAGGIVGFGGIAIACRNSGSISGTNNNAKDMYSGGISGQTKTCIACINTGSVFASSSGGSAYTGGIIGDLGNSLGCYWLSGKGANSIIGKASISLFESTEEQLKNKDRKNTIINDMNTTLKIYYDTNNITDRYYWTYEGSADGYPTVTTKKIIPNAGHLTVSEIPASKVCDGQPVVAVTATVKFSGMGTLGKVKYNDSTTVPSEPGSYIVTVDITEGTDYRAGTITLGSFEITQNTLTLDNLNVSGIPVGGSKTYDGNPVTVKATPESGIGWAR